MQEAAYDGRIDYKSAFKSAFATWSENGIFWFFQLEHGDKYHSVTVVNDLLVVSGEEKLRFYDIHTLLCSFQLSCPPRTEVYDVGLATRVLVTNRDGSFLYDYSSGALVLLKQWEFFTVLAVSTAGQLALVRLKGNCLLLDLKTHEMSSSLGDGEFAAFSEDGLRLGVITGRGATNSHLYLYDIVTTGDTRAATVRSSSLVLLRGNPGMQLAFCGKYLLVGTKNHRLLSVDENCNIISQFDSAYFRAGFGLVVRGKEVFVPSTSEMTRMFRLSETGHLIHAARFKRHTYSLSDIAIAADLLFTTGQDGLRIWHIPPVGAKVVNNTMLFQFQLQYEALDCRQRYWSPHVEVHKDSGLVFVLHMDADQVLVGCQGRTLDLPPYSYFA